MNFEMHAHVPNLLDNEGKWDLDFLRDIFYEQDLPRITSTPVSSSHSDARYWRGDLRGLYTVRQGYKLLTRNILQHDFGFGFVEWKKLWSIKIPSKVHKFFMALYSEYFTCS